LYGTSQPYSAEGWASLGLTVGENSNPPLQQTLLSLSASQSAAASSKIEFFLVLGRGGKPSPQSWYALRPAVFAWWDSGMVRLLLADEVTTA
jgi:hypothetical protein